MILSGSERPRSSHGTIRGTTSFTNYGYDVF